MKYYPLNLDIHGKKIVVIGGGSIAHQKIVGLLQAGGKVTVIAPQILDSLKELSQRNEIVVIQREYQKGDIAEAFLVFGATNNPWVNKTIHEEAKQKGILFNAVDQPEECDFIIPSKISRGDLLLTISTSGEAPFLSKKIRERLETIFGEEFEDFVKLAGKLRKLLIQAGRKEELVPFFDQYGEKILLAIKNHEHEMIDQIIENSLGLQIPPLNS